MLILLLSFTIAALTDGRRVLSVECCKDRWKIARKIKTGAHYTIVINIMLAVYLEELSSRQPTK